VKYMLLIHAGAVTGTGDAEGCEPADWTAYDKEVRDAGILVSGESLADLVTATTVRVGADGRRTVTDGPFAETKELVAGFWLWQVKSIDEAIEWAKRCPNPTGEDSVLEIRPVFEAEDFGPELAPEVREQEARLRAQAADRT